MRCLFLLVCLFSTQIVFAQNEETNPTVIGIADMLSKGMCECFNEHALPKLSDAAHRGLEKLAQRNVTTREEAQKILSIKEIISISNEMEKLTAQEDSEFAECQSDVGLGMMQYSGQITEITAHKIMTEEELDARIQAQTLIALGKNKDCKKAYCLYMIGQK